MHQNGQQRMRMAAPRSYFHAKYGTLDRFLTSLVSFVPGSFPVATGAGVSAGASTQVQPPHGRPPGDLSFYPSRAGMVATAPGFVALPWQRRENLLLCWYFFLFVDSCPFLIGGQSSAVGVGWGCLVLEPK